MKLDTTELHAEFVEYMRSMGQLAGSMSLTDEQLTNLIDATEAVIAYLEGRGPGWNLAYFPLKIDLESYRRIQSYRQESAKRGM